MRNLLLALLLSVTSAWSATSALVGGVRRNYDTTGTNTTTSAVTITGGSGTNLNAGVVNATNSVNVGRAGETGVVQLTSTNSTYTLTFSLLSNGTLVITNNGVLVDTLALSSLYAGDGTLFKSDDGTYKAVTSPAGAVVTNLNINPTDNYLPYRSNATTFGDSALYRVNTTNIATDARFVWGPGTTNVLYRSGSNLTYTNGATAVIFKVVNGSSGTVTLGLGSNGHGTVQSETSSLFLGADNGNGLVSLNAGALSPATTLSLGNSGSSGRWTDLYASNVVVYTHVVWNGSTNTVFDLAGSGSPEGVITAAPGSTYRNYAGGATNTFWVKESGGGNTGWVNK